MHPKSDDSVLAEFVANMVYQKGLSPATWTECWNKESSKLDMIEWPCWVWAVGPLNSKLVPAGIEDGLYSYLDAVDAPLFYLGFDFRWEERVIVLTVDQCAEWLNSLGELQQTDDGRIFDRWSTQCYGNVQLRPKEKTFSVLAASRAHNLICHTWAKHRIEKPLF